MKKLVVIILTFLSGYCFGQGQIINMEYRAPVPGITALDSIFHRYTGQASAGEYFINTKALRNFNFGHPTAGTQSIADSSVFIATTAFVKRFAWANRTVLDTHYFRLDTVHGLQWKIIAGSGITISGDTIKSTGGGILGNPSGLLTFTVTNGSSTLGLRLDGLHAIDSNTVASRARLLTYLTKAQIVAGYAPIFSGTGYSKYASGALSYITSIPNADLANSTVSGVSLGNTLFAHLPGFGIAGSNYDGHNTQTWVADTTSALKGKAGFLTDYNNLSTRINAKAYSLIPTAVKTSSYTLAVNDYVPTNSTSGTVPLTLPTAPANASIVGVKMVIQGSTNTTTITAGGSDVFNKSGGGTVLTLSLLNQGVLLQYNSGIWYVLSDDLSLTQLDLRYAPFGSSGTPGGSNTNIQFNNSGAFGGDANFVWNNTAKSLGIGSTTLASRLTIGSTSASLLYAYLTFFGFGDSITTGTGASPSSNSYINLLATSLGITLHNKALSGDYAADIVDSVYSVTPSNTNQLYTLMIGTNDAMNYSTNNQALTYNLIIGAEAAYLTIPNASKIFGQTGGSYTGTWANSTFYGGAMGKVSQTNGSTVTFTTTGTVAYIAFTMQDSNVGVFSLTVDGVIKGSFTCAGVSGALINTQHSRNYADGLIRVAGLSSGAHTCVMTVTSSTSASNKVYFDWAAGNTGAGTSGWPTLYQTDIPINSFPLNTNTYNQLISKTVGNLALDGLNIHFVDAAAATTNFLIYSADGIHPNNAGHAAIFNTLLGVIKSTTNPAVNTVAVNSSTGAPQQIISGNGFNGTFTNAPTSPETIQSPSAVYDNATQTTALLPILALYNTQGLSTFELRANTLNNLAFGRGAGVNLGSAINNFYAGYNAGANDTTGSNNIHIGYLAGYTNITASDDNFLGFKTGYANTTGSNNNFFGHFAGTANTTGLDNNFFGFSAGVSNLTGFNDNYFGNSSGNLGTASHDNNFFGNGSGANNTSNYGNFFGYQAGNVNTGFGNNFFGYHAGFANTSGTTNIMIGFDVGSANQTGSNLIFMGNTAGQSNTSASDAIYIGKSAGQSANGAQNVSIGTNSSFQNLLGAGNVFVGYYAGAQNALGNTMTKINNSIYIGSLSTSGRDTLTNVINIGYQARNDVSNTTVLGNSSSTQASIYGALLTKTAPTAINSTATATAAQMATGYITSTSAAATTITTPTATALATLMKGVRGASFHFTIDNTAGANTVTLALDASFTQLTGVSASLTVPTGVTGVGKWDVAFVSPTACTISRIQ